MEMLEEVNKNLLWIDLQWFAAEDEGRTEDPTEQKLRKAREEEGKVAKSSELSSALVLLFSIITLAFIASYMFNTMTEMMRFFLSKAVEVDITSDASVVPAFYTYFIKLALPIAAIAFITALLGNLVQVGFLFTTKPLKPDFSKIAPKFGKFIQRSFLSGEALFNFAKNIGKVALIGAISFFTISSEIHQLANIIGNPIMQCLIYIAGLALRILILSALAMLLISIPDYMFQKFQHKESLKMSQHEIKEERKQYEGDPQVKNRLQERMRDLLSNNVSQSVENADVVITNPTHFAVALEWDKTRMEAPVVAAKGQDNMAARIKEIAREKDVPIVENKPLARALFSEVEVGDIIPEQYYRVTAVILAEVYKMSGKSEAAV